MSTDPPTGTWEPGDELPEDPDLDVDLAPGGRLVPVHLRPSVLAIVAFGGAVGTLGRFGVTAAVPDVDRLPLGTLLVNVVGAFLLGLLMEIGPGERLRLLLGTGLLGGFTTYSAYAVDAQQLVDSHEYALALAYLLMTIAAGFAASILGISAGRRWRR